MTNSSKVFVQRSFECDAETLFDWLTKPELITRWFGPEKFSTGEVKNNLSVGGVYSIELRRGDNLAFTIKGEYIEIQKPAFLKFTYNYLNLKNAPPPSVVSFRLTSINTNRTEISMIQKFQVETPDFSTRSAAWNFMFDQLVRLL